MSRLDLDLILRRTGWEPWAAAALILAALIIEFFGTAKLGATAGARNTELDRLQALAAQTPAVSPPGKLLIEQRYEAFLSALGDKSDLNRYVAIVFAQARKYDLTLAQAEYKLDFDAQGRFHMYRMTLPVVGDYPRLRRFVDTTLQAVPCVALEDVVFQREGIRTPTTEAKLRFVFYLRNTP